MPVIYRMVPNSLTKEPSYRADVIQEVVEYEELIDDISLRVPNVDRGTILNVLSTLRTVVAEKLIDGKTNKQRR